MIAKKNSRFDLERKRIVLFQIGLLTAGSFTLAAFTYTSTVEVEHEKKAVGFEIVDYRVEFEKPKVEEPKVQQPRVQNNQQQANNNSNAATQNMTVTKNTSTTVTAKVGPLGPPGPPIDTGIIVIVLDDSIVDIPDIDAEYIGGIVEMQKFVRDNMKYPEADQQLGVQGRVYVSFVVEKDGSLTNVKIERGISDGIDREAKRIVRSFPKWKPGETAYGKVRTRVRLPFNFTLE